MVIAHEITHGFDDQGRRFDADGHLRDWWTPEDAARFTELADRLVDQFEAYVVLDDVHVNGRLTLGENIADLGGLTLAERALARVADGAPDIDGLTPAQRFFLANATLWRANISPALQRTLAGIDPHSPRRAAGARPGLQPRGVPGRLRAPRRGADHAPARAADRDLVMKAIAQDAYGTPEVLSLREIDPPVAGDDELLIRVHAAGRRAGRVAPDGRHAVHGPADGLRRARPEDGWCAAPRSRVSSRPSEGTSRASRRATRSSASATARPPSSRARARRSSLPSRRTPRSSRRPPCRSRARRRCRPCATRAGCAQASTCW